MNCCCNEDSLSASLSWQPSGSTTVKLLATGATVGTLVDSLHNQILLEYHVALIQLPSPFSIQAEAGEGALWLASSWTVPPLLAVAYWILGGILPRITRKFIHALAGPTTSRGGDTSTTQTQTLRNRALWAITTTALIVKLSDVLERHPDWCWMTTFGADTQHLILLFMAALLQWWVLDGTKTALLLACITAYGGPLAELPFVQANVWTYLPDAANYFPLQGSGPMAQALRALLHDDSTLAISTVSAPCYFAVCMDAIALGRWFDAQDSEGSK